MSSFFPSLRSSRAAWYVGGVAFPLVACALFAVPPPAAACSKGSCARGYVAPAEGATIPANAPALVVGRSTVPAGTTVASLSTDAGATTVPLTATLATGYPVETLLRLGEPLEEGKTYALTHYQSCLPDASAGNATVSFLAGPAAPLPTSSGSIAVAETGVDDAYEVGGTTACTFEVRAAVLRFAFTPAADLTPYLPVTRFRLTVDGADSSYLTDHGVDPTAIVKEAYWSRSRIELFAMCEAPADPTLARGMALGKHTWSWQAEIAGAETQPAPTTGSFELTCPPMGGGGNLGGAGGVTGGGAGASGSVTGGASGGLASAPTAGSGGAQSPAGASPSSAEEGCAVSGPRPGPSSAWLAPLALLLASRARRRRAHAGVAPRGY